LEKPPNSSKLTCTWAALAIDKIELKIETMCVGKLYPKVSQKLPQKYAFPF